MTPGVHVLQTVTINGQSYDFAISKDAEFPMFVLHFSRGSAVAINTEFIASQGLSYSGDGLMPDFIAYVAKILASFNAQLAKLFGHSPGTDPTTFDGQIEEWIKGLHVVVDANGVPQIISA